MWKRRFYHAEKQDGRCHRRHPRHRFLHRQDLPGQRRQRDGVRFPPGDRGQGPGPAHPVRRPGHGRLPRPVRPGGGGCGLCRRQGEVWRPGYPGEQRGHFFPDQPVRLHRGGVRQNL